MFNAGFLLLLVSFRFAVSRNKAIMIEVTLLWTTAGYQLRRFVMRASPTWSLFVNLIKGSELGFNTFSCSRL